MKLLLLMLCSCLFGVGIILASPINEPQSKLLGSKQCTWGPSYWCSNITNAKSCNAVRHCIQTVWETHTVPEDNDSICKICLDMVAQARDQLESNETQEDLKAVFEGSCALIPLKPIRIECDKLVDNFVPELVEALSSQMNPQAVCSVAGLCNNAAIDKMLDNINQMKRNDKDTSDTTKLKQLSCEQCSSVSSLISQNFHKKNRDEFLESMISICGKMSSFSDACANIVIVYFNEIYNELNNNLNSENICHMAGVCSEKYHQHPEFVEIRPMSDVGFVTVTDDIPCELCEQLVGHLRDLLIANTTEAEFKEVLQGICKQTKSFKSECLSIVDEYYDVIYNTLVKNLNANEACCVMEICPRGKLVDGGAYIPLLPIETAQKVVKISSNTKEKFILGSDEPLYSTKEIQNAQLPIDKLLSAPNPDALVEGGEWCAFCEYFLHFVQETISSPKTEEKIKHVVNEACDKWPKSLIETCHTFVDTYGDAVVALLVQEIDPKDVCPQLHICPQNTNDFEVFSLEPMKVTINTQTSGSEKCPLCLLAIEEAETIIKKNKSTENIKRTLKSLCSHLTLKLQSECTDFVDTYTAELLRMLATDFTPQQICVYLKVCTDGDNSVNVPISGGDIATNEIPDYTYNGHLIKSVDADYVPTPNCLICQEVIKEAEKNIVNKKSKGDIKRALEHACDRLHKLKNKCNAIVDKHGDEIVDLLLKEMTPKMVCRELGMCVAAEDNLEINDGMQVTIIDVPSKFDQSTSIANVNDSAICVVCEYIMSQLDTELKDKTKQKEIEDTVRNICHKMPKTIDAQCTKFINDYGSLIITLIATTPPKELCTQMQLCSDKSREESKVEIIECAICHASTNAIVEIFENPKIERSVEGIIEKICTSMPGKYYERCITMIESYGQSMINIINRGELQTVCSQIGMCYADEYQSFVKIERGGDNYLL